MKFLIKFRSAKNSLFLVGVNLVVFLILTEITSLVFYGIQDRKLFYTRDRNHPDLIQADSEIRGITLDAKSTLEKLKMDESWMTRLHPYFGFVYKPRFPHPGINVNNMGFISPFDFPFKKQNKNQLIIGIFGGSVASNLAINDFYLSILRKNLQESAFFKDKEIIILNLALGGYKQPQQLLTLNYFLAIGQEFDMVINIDGFNEVALSNLNNHNSIDISMPSFQHTAPLVNMANQRVSEAEMIAMGKIYQIKDKFKHELEASDRCWFASCYTFRWLSTQIWLKAYTKEVKKFDQIMSNHSEVNQNNAAELDDHNSVIQVQRTPPLDDRDAMKQMAEIWANASSAMNQILSSRGIPYFHFLQPNQYYPTGRVFSPEEQKIAIVLSNNPYVSGVQIGYPFLLENIKNLQNNNVNIYNTTHVFDREKMPTYSDACCHYNLKGNEILAKFVAQEIFKKIKIDQTQKSVNIKIKT